jgi:hypothetical protein
MEQQLNISKTLRSVFPNHGIMTSVFLYPGIGIDENSRFFLFTEKRRRTRK